VLVVENLGSDPLDGDTDKSGRARSTATTKVREDSGNGFVGGVGDVVSISYCSPKAVRAGEASPTLQEIVYRRMVLGAGTYVFMVV
jgi:hypothetical protein